MANSFSCIGVMSGTSMDGVDIAHCIFTENEGNWTFTITAADCISYPEIWLRRLVNLSNQTAETFAKTNVFYGHFLGQCVHRFIEQHNLIEQTDLVSSHGQTVFHNPGKGYTIQIGHGAAIAKECNLPVACDLRSSDMAYDGQGAPIVPLGEKYLFPNYRQFINIGGISNVSIHSEKEVIGYDVCMGNLLLDGIANKAGKIYDNEGQLARSGKINEALLEQLNKHSYLDKKPPKTFDAGEVLSEFFPLVEQANIAVEDQLATLVEHIAMQLAQNLQNQFPVFLTGGGAFNTFLVERLQAHFAHEVILPNKQIIEYKEALIIAFLGVLRLQNQVNVLASVTGAKKDTVNGALYLP